MTDNLKLWQSVEKTPKDQTKAITGKSYSGTSPKPHYLVRKATETFGPCGIGWGFQIVDERIEEGAGGERLSIARVKVWYEWEGRRGEVEHIGGTQFSGTRKSGQPFTDEDAPKKSVTDALVKALSMIGFAGDIFMGRYDDSKYVRELEAEARQEPAAGSIPASRGAGGGSLSTAPAPANRTSGGETLTGRETGAVKQGPAPVSPITHEQAAIISSAETFMFNATDEDELDQWAKDNAAECKRLGIVSGSAAGKRLREIIEKRRVEIREADMPAGQLEAAE